jgi:hypothetical protein
MGACPWIVIANAIFPEQLIGLLSHERIVDPRKLPVPLDQLLRAQPPPVRQRAQLSYSNAITGDVIDLPRLHRIHNRGEVVSKLAFSDDFHAVTNRAQDRR